MANPTDYEAPSDGRIYGRCNGAWVPLTGITPPPPPPPPPPPGGGFSGGKSQVNFNFLQTGGEFPFLNCLKTAQTWTWNDNTGAPMSDGTKINASGYPIAIEHGGLQTVFFIPTQAERPGNYRLKWTGTGTISGNSGTDGRVTITAPGGSDGRIALNITSGTNVSDISFVHVDDVAAYDAGEIWGTRFLTKLREGKFGVLRFLNWGPYNTSNMRVWADRKPASYAFYNGDELRAGMGAGTTGGTATAYTCSAPSGWGGLKDKAIATVKWHVSASSITPTLAVGGTAAKPIKGPAGELLYNDANGNITPTLNWISTCIYDADLDCWLHNGGGLAFDNCWLRNGVPPELMIDLCAKVGAHPWFTMPFMACDPITDYAAGLATYCRDNAPTWMIPRFEVPNECWNSLFNATNYANRKVMAQWGLGNNRFSEWVGKVGSTMGQAVSAVYGNDRTRYQTIVGVQTVVNPPDVNERLTSAQYVAHGGKPAKDWITHVCCANYYGSDYYGTPQETTWANEWAAGDAATKAARVASYIGGCGTNLANVKIRYAAWKAWVAGFGIKLCGYEGGYSPDYASYLGSSTVDRFREATKASPALNGYTTTNYANFANVGGEFPSCFQLGGPDNAWSVFDPSIWSVPSPQWTAIVAYNA